MKCHKCLVARPQGPKQQDHLAWLEKALLKCKVHNGCVSVRVGGLNGGQIMNKKRDSVTDEVRICKTQINELNIIEDSLIRQQQGIRTYNTLLIWELGLWTQPGNNSKFNSKVNKPTNLSFPCSGGLLQVLQLGVQRLPPERQKTDRK